MSVLEKILAAKKLELSKLEENWHNTEITQANLDFKAVISKSINQSTPNLIAEIKKASPSKGQILKANTDIVSIAKTYEHLGAKSISVLTDAPFFGGTLCDLKQVSNEISTPSIRKDFIFDKRQIIQARINGASAILLMTSVVKTAPMLRKLREYAESMSMHALVETQDEREIEIAVESGARIIGVNARHFSDLSVDINRVPPLLQKIPAGIIRVAESGMSKKEDIDLVAPYCDAVLIGTGLLTDGVEKIPSKIKALFN